MKITKSVNCKSYDVEPKGVERLISVNGKSVVRYPSSEQPKTRKVIPDKVVHRMMKYAPGINPTGLEWRAEEESKMENNELDFLAITEEKTNIWKQIMSSLLDEISDVFTEEEVFIIALKNQDKIDQEIAKTLRIKETELIGKIKVILEKYREFINANINNSLDKYERKLSIK